MVLPFTYRIVFGNKKCKCWRKFRPKNGEIKCLAPNMKRGISKEYNKPKVIYLEQRKGNFQ